MEVTLNMGYLDDILKTHLDNKTLALAQGFKDSLDSPIFSWGSITHRKNGDVVSDPRNAIDTGNLQKSIEAQIGRRFTNDITFNVEYAALVLEHSSVDFVEFTIERIGE